MFETKQPIPKCEYEIFRAAYAFIYVNLNFQIKHEHEPVIAW